MAYYKKVLNPAGFPQPQPQPPIKINSSTTLPSESEKSHSAIVKEEKKLIPEAGIQDSSLNSDFELNFIDQEAKKLRYKFIATLAKMKILLPPSEKPKSHQTSLYIFHIIL